MTERAEGAYLRCRLAWVLREPPRYSRVSLAQQLCRPTLGASMHG